MTDKEKYIAGQEAWLRIKEQQSAVDFKSEYQCEPVPSAPKRYKDPPPADMAPDPEFRPRAEEWFWWKSCIDGWILRECKRDGLVYNSLGKRGNCGDLITYKGDCLPATAPE